MNDSDETQLDDLPSEVADSESSLETYEIVTYPADYTLKGLVDKWKRGQVRIPEFQRDFVWKQTQGSKLIESFLLGLPVPSIFLYTDRNDRNNQLVVDGQQRLRTVAFFFEGYFGEPNRQGKRQVFRLTGLHERSPFLGKTYKDLEAEDPSAWNRLNDAVLRAFIIQQLNPADDTSIYHVFERLNTGGTLLYPQEIRNAVSHGRFNELLSRLNMLESWRDLYGTPRPDKRKRDVELILRILALSHSPDEYKKPMKDFLNVFMQRHKMADDATLELFESRFKRALTRIDLLGTGRPFRRGAGLNAAILDSVMCALTAEATPTGARHGGLAEAYAALLADDAYIEEVTKSTTDDDSVRGRLSRARNYLE